VANQLLHIDCGHYRLSTLLYNLSSMGFEIHKTSDMQEAREMMENHHYHLILISFEFISKSIFEICSSVCSDSPGTIVIVLMKKVRIHIEGQLFDCGVNDVVVGRQTSSHVLLKRILAHFRNSKLYRSQKSCIKLKDTVVDLGRREVRINGMCHPLRGILADLLKYFLDNANRVVSREELEKSYIWADSICTPAKEGGKTFDVSVGKLRKLIEPNPSRPEIIKAVRGIGWKLSEEFVK